MRKTLLAVAVATALFAVGAFAATFSVQSEDVASGSDPVTACAKNVDIDFDAPTPNASGDWMVGGATVSFYANGGPNPELTPDCDGYNAQLALMAPGVNTITTSALVAGGEIHFQFDNAFAVSAITKASVVVDGKTLTADV